jgi:hypothetical protein
MLRCLTPWFVLLVACRAYNPPALDTGAFDSCCSGTGTCVPSVLVGSDMASQLTTDSCQDPLLCVPSELAGSSGGRLSSCTVSSTGAEGRCAPSCLPKVAAMAERLERDDCTQLEMLCVPCFDPLSGEGTGACELGSDRGPTDAPRVFTHCCHDAGRCLPPSLLPDDVRERVASDECRETDFLCVPELWLSDASNTPQPCRAVDTEAEGRCLPDCLPEVARRKEQLTQSDCGSHELCTPCFDPVSGEATGACTIEEDAPKEPALVFGTCCGDQARCLPEHVVPSDQRGRLERQTCGERELCTPQAWVSDADHVPDACRVSSTGAQGSCLPSCLSAVAEQMDRLTQEDCADEERCVPCYDPISGESTGACTAERQAAIESPVVFEACCDGLGRCVDSAQVPESTRPRLGRESCAERELCAPSTFLKDVDFVAPTCRTSTSDSEGRCLPACLTTMATGAANLRRDGCPEQELCVPCTNPIDGSTTGACNLGEDPGPAEAPHVLASCCGGEGRCVQRKLLDPMQQQSLGQDECDDSQQLCAPLLWLKDPNAVAASCRSSASRSEGRCLATCLPPVRDRAESLHRDGCEEHQLCVPCFDPIDGKATGACAIGGDEGPEWAGETYPNCCGEKGRCVPAESVPGNQREQLGPDVCVEQDTLCVPQAYIEDSNAVARLCRVSATQGGEGRCLPSCLPQVAARKEFLAQDDCPDEHRCVPCFDPFTGEPSGACSIGADSGPTRPPVVFARCCDGRALCLVGSTVDAERRERATRDSCEAEQVCIPEEFVQTSDFVPATCRDPVLKAEGRCLSTCLGAVQEQLDRLQVAECHDDERCVPCYDPVSGKATGACSLAPGDPGPKQAPVVLDTCCPHDGRDLGRCVGRPWLPDSSLSLPTLSCGSDDFVCAPSVLVEDPDDGHLPSCSSIQTSRGACVPRCMVPSTVLSFTWTGTCDDGATCVPCFIGPQWTGVCW